MKKIYIRLFISCFTLLAFTLSSLGATPTGWSQKYEPQKVFIQNKGQFTLKESPGFDAKVQYAFDGDGQRFYMTKSGVVFELTDIEKAKESKNKEHEEREMKDRSKKGVTTEDYEKMEREERKMTVTRDELRAQWIGANPDVEIIAEDKIDPYFSYSFKNKEGKEVNENLIPGYAKLTYRNIYPNIDVVYEVHPQGGIKYSVIVHPGGGISQVRLQYSKKARLLADGDIRTRSVFGDFIDHAPNTFYEDDKTPVKSSYTLRNNAISFAVGDHDLSKTIVIDPWTQSPAFAGSGGWPCVWECQKDAAGNVYVIGGVSPMKLIKYNSTGTLQWTYNTPYDTAGGWLGTFAVDNPGNSYVTNGTPEAIIQVNTSGGVGWTNPNPPGLSILAEFWSISFNCDQTQMIIGGTSGTTNPTPTIYNVDVATGTVLSSVQVTGPGSLFAIPPPTQEVRAICACGNGNYYFLTHDSIGYIHQGTAASCVSFGSSEFHTASGYDMGYKCEDWRANNTGIKAIKAFGSNVYTARGNQIDKRLFSTGAIIGTATIPGGAYTLTLGQGQVSNSGIDIDSCGHVFVGSANEVVEYDQNLNQLATFPTSSNFYVYDVQVAPGGVLVAAGSNGNDNTNGARAGYVETFAGGACAPIAIVCCDASICPHATVCSNAAAFNFTATTPGGLWSGTGITNATNGTFNPSVAGVGTFTIYYTLPCGMDSTTITVANCSALSVCRNANGSLTVSGGSAPYTWAVWDSVGQHCSGVVIFGICTGTEETTYGWTTVTTGTTFTPPSQSDTIKVSTTGAADSIYNISALPLCVTCNLTVSAGAQTNVNCFGASTGIAHVTVTGGTTPYTYTWSPLVSSNDSATGLAAGTYDVTVHDAGGCTGTATFTITQPTAAVSATTTITPATCGNSNGKVVVTASGGTPGYTYIWSPNVSTIDSAVNLAVNTYDITVTDSKGCTFATSASVTSSSGLTVSPGAQTNVNCFGNSTGIAHVTVSGGTSPYTYTWSPNVSTKDSATGLAAGTYTVTVHDAGGCSGSATFTITQPATPLGATTLARSVTCGLGNGKVIVTASGGTPGYTYTWSPNVSTTDSALNLTANTYDITVTDSKGCTVTASGIVLFSSGITVAPGAQTNVLCFGASTGAAHVTVSGGTTPYTYTWSPNVSTTDSAVNLAAGTYTVTVHDAGGCTGTATFTITQPATRVSATDTNIAAFCGNNDGKVYVTPAGGTPGYTYTWSPNVSTNDSAINLGTGSYSITVKDANNCTAAITAVVSSANGVTASPGAQTNVNCFGGSTGVAHVTASGGTLPYTYTWSPNVSTVDSAVGLSAGIYNVTVKDANGCQSIVTFTITQPLSALSATDTTLPAYCGNSTGKVYITPSGGTPGYSYTWSPNVSTNDSAVHLAAGNYLITVTDTKGCTTTLTATVQPAAGATISLVSKQDVTCNGGSNGNIYVTASGGVGPYTYTWSPSVSTLDSAVNLAPGNYTVTVHDANNCTSSISETIGQPAAINITTTTTQANCGVSNGTALATVTNGVSPFIYQWSAGTPTDSLDTGLPAGSYTVTVTDANHCSASGTAAVSNIGAPTATIASITNVSCNGGNNGRIVLNVNGGTQPYSYTWSPNVSTVDSGVNLTAGTYIVTVQDASNCVAIVDTIITQPSVLSATVQSGNTNCGQSTGWAKINVSGGTGSYTYVWSVPQATDSITGLAGGMYYVTVTDSLGCQYADSVSVATNAGPLAPIVSVSGPVTFCQGGSVTLTSTASSGNTWSTGATSQSIIVSASGTYTVTQTVGGCTSPASAPVTVTVNPIPPAPTITPSGPLSFCQGGSVTLTSSSPSGNLWSDNETTQSIVVTAAGIYSVSDTVGGCPSPPSAPVTVSIISVPLITINASQPSLCPGIDSIILDATTASATSYLWSTSSTQPSITVTAPGVYKVSVTVNGCQGTDTITITSQPLLGTLTLQDSFSICPGDSVKLDATTANATSYIWTGAANASVPIIVVDSEGVYEVKVSNSCGSTGSSTVVSFKDCECRIVMPSAFTPNGDGKNDFFGPEYDCANATSLSMRIYDRWGEMVYETNDLHGQWDGNYKGTPQSPGVYVYYVEFVGVENNTTRNFKLMGSLTLIR